MPSGLARRSAYGGVYSLYRREGTARVPASCNVGPPNWTGNSLGGPYACAGSWQVAHDIRPEAESDGSKNRTLPTLAAGPSGEKVTAGLTVSMRPATTRTPAQTRTGCDRVRPIVPRYFAEAARRPSTESAQAFTWFVSGPCCGPGGVTKPLF